MFSLNESHRYILCTSATDMRKGFDSLCGLVGSQLGRDPLSGEVFIFLNRLRTVIKLLHWERGGLVIYHKRLEKGRFALPDYDAQKYAGYDRYKHREKVTLLGCAAHCRRKFEHAKENDAKRSRQALTLFARLYQIEARAREENLSFDERLEQRNKHSLEVIYELKELLESWRMQLLPKSLIGQAIAYTYTIYPRLARYVIDRRYRMDNNLAENGVKPLALGRKNYLFAGSHDGASCNAMMYSFFRLLQNC